MIHILDAVIIGAGPAGLSAGMVLKNENKKYIILEKGKNIADRDANTAEDVSMGVGGGGLFADGKLSFPPSASKLWSELNTAKVEKAYTQLESVLNCINIKLPNFDKAWINGYAHDSKNTFVKEYPSIILNDFMRASLLNLFYQANRKHLVTNCCVQRIERYKTYYQIITDAGIVYFSRNIIICSGRFGSNLLCNIPNVDHLKKIQKIEMGIRAESTPEAFIPYSSLVYDHKIIKKIEDDVEFRTFCCCKDGVVLQTAFDNYISFNGAKSPFKTNNSNIGLLIRASNKQSIYYQEMERFLMEKSRSFKVSIKDFLNPCNIYVGENCDKLLREMLAKVIDLNSSELSNFSIYGPEIEYIGDYVTPNSDLTISDNIWLAGDVVGTFRGLIAAMISGIYSANDCIAKECAAVHKNIAHLGINISSIENMDLVFTAQSKKFFYCKDVICQYVLENDKLPINPFRVFDYFLNDRVDRDLIRRGNNQLIQSCSELWVFGPIADGVLFEIALAKLLGKKIRFFSIGTRVNEIQEIFNLNDVVFESEVHSKKIKKDDLIMFIADKNIDDGQLEIFMS